MSLRQRLPPAANSCSNLKKVFFLFPAESDDVLVKEGGVGRSVEDFLVQ